MIKNQEDPKAVRQYQIGKPKKLEQLNNLEEES